MTVASGSSYSSLLYVSSGNGSNGYLETYDVSAGTKTVVGPTNDSSAHYLTDLAWSPSGTLYGIDFTNIYTINPATGAVTRIGSFSGNSFNGLVFDAGGTPYISSVNDGDIYTFNLASLSTSSATAVTLKFSSPATTPNGEALDSAGDLAWIGNELYYTVAGSSFTTFYLYKVPAGGTATQLVGQIKTAAGTAISNVFGLSTDGYGTLYAQADTALYTLDKTTGIATTVNASIAANAISGGAMRYEFTQVLDDFGDYSGFAVARDTVYSGTLQMGALIDYDIPAAFNAAATADDLAWLDDEDGVTLPASVVQGSTGNSVTVKVTNTSGAPAFLNGWIDFNNNGVVTDAGEQVVNNVTVANGTSNVSQTYTFNVPATAAVGNVGVRFRLTAVSNPGSTGASGPGEVEDYLLTITCSSVSLSPTTLTTPTVGTAYSQAVTASGGNAPYTYAVATGTLPTGLTLNTSTGVLSGTVTSSSAVSFTLRATDAKGCIGTLAWSFTPICPVVTVGPATLNTPTVGTAFSQTLSATGGLSPYSWALTSGSQRDCL